MQILSLNEGLINDLAEPQQPGAPSGCHCHTGLPPELLAQLRNSLGPEGEEEKHPIPLNSPWSSVPASEGALANDLEVIHPLSGNLNLAEVI